MTLHLPSLLMKGPSGTEKLWFCTPLCSSISLGADTIVVDSRQKGNRSKVRSRAQLIDSGPDRTAIGQDERSNSWSYFAKRQFLQVTRKAAQMPLRRLDVICEIQRQEGVKDDQTDDFLEECSIHDWEQATLPTGQHVAQQVALAHAFQRSGQPEKQGIECRGTQYIDNDHPLSQQWPL